jgi:predicted dehydrogenase
VPYLHATPDSGQGAVGISRSLSREDAFREQLRDFIEAIEHGREGRVTPRDGLEAVRAGLAAVEAARTGRPVDVASVTA